MATKYEIIRNLKFESGSASFKKNAIIRNSKFEKSSANLTDVYFR